MKRSCGAPWVSKSTHPRKFGNHVTVHRPPSRTTGKPMFNLTLSCTHIAHQCYDQLTAVRTGYQLSSITWPYRGLRCCPFEVEYVFEVIRWQVTSFQMIASSSLFFLIHMKHVVFCMCRTIKMLISNWPRRKLKIQPVFTGGEDVLVAFDFSHQGHALVTFCVQFLCSDWSKFDSWVHAENLCSILKLTCLFWQLKLTEFCVNLWCF